MTSLPLVRLNPHLRDLARAASAAAATALRRLTGSWARRRAIRYLDRLPDRLMDDIGIERSQIAEIMRTGGERHLAADHWGGGPYPGGQVRSRPPAIADTPTRCHRKGPVEHRDVHAGPDRSAA